MQAKNGARLGEGEIPAPAPARAGPPAGRARCNPFAPARLRAFACPRARRPVRSSPARAFAGALVRTQAGQQAPARVRACAAGHGMLPSLRCVPFALNAHSTGHRTGHPMRHRTHHRMHHRTGHRTREAGACSLVAPRGCSREARRGGRLLRIHSHLHARASVALPSRCPFAGVRTGARPSRCCARAGGPQPGGQPAAAPPRRPPRSLSCSRRLEAARRRRADGLALPARRKDLPGWARLATDRGYCNPLPGLGLQLFLPRAHFLLAAITALW